MRVWANGHAEKEPQEKRFTPKRMSSVRKKIEAMADIPWREARRSIEWGLFDTSGGRVRRLSQARGLLLVFEGGRWVWPGVRSGFHRQLVLPPAAAGGEPREVVMTTMSCRPLIYKVEGLLQDRELAQYTVEKSYYLFKRSHYHNKQWSHGKHHDYKRGDAKLDHFTHPQLEHFMNVSMQVFRLPRRLHGPVEAAEYNVGQLAHAHHDAYRMHSSTPDTIRKYLKKGANRMVTGVWYLNDVAKGGATFFPGPEVNKTKDFEKCQGKMNQPRFGDFLFYYNLLPSGQVDGDTWHGSCKVEEGVKHVVFSSGWNYNVPPRWEANPHPLLDAEGEADEPDAVSYGPDEPEDNQEL
eukprot:SRR837773.4882.p1 GENE.SRR837773.4882~~SRR837773.4882.p1  ORF type:complete len:372 (+),score=136.56 SRR837773.4882:61-1116(+)